MSDLKPCPFCGDVDALEVQHLDGTTRYPAYRVACDNCGAACGYREKGQHIEEWNTRALPAVQPDAAALDGARTALENIRELNLSGADEHGRKWANSDLIEQEIVAALALIDRPAHVNETPKSEHDARDVLTPATKKGGGGA